MANSDLNIVEVEIDGLVKTHKTDCKVIRNIGDYAFVVEVKNIAGVLNAKFLLPELYPTSSPDVILRSDVLPNEAVAVCQEEVNKTIAAHPRQCIIDIIIKSLTSLPIVTSCQNQDSPFTAAGKKSNGDGNKHAKQHKKSKMKKVDKEYRDEKLVSMRDAEQVISRIRWDPQLSVDDFTIGYLDRFVGVIEKPFSSFSWEDIASVDYDVLAIPQHRIQYFKYRGTKVWDKNVRLDNVFGSTGSGLTISEIVAQMEKGIIAYTEDNVAEIAAADEGTSNTDSDDEDDNIVVTIGNSSIPTTATAASNNRISSDEDFDSNEDNNQSDPMLTQHDLDVNNKPTHFLCVPITDDAVQNAMRRVQSDIVEQHPWLEPYHTTEDRLHLTVCLHHLDTQDQVDSYCSRLNTIQASLVDVIVDSHEDRPRISFKGIGYFNTSVVYAKAELNSCTADIFKCLKESLASAGFGFADSHEFIAHVSLFKVTKKHLAASLKAVSTSVCDKYAISDLGSQMVHALELRSVMRNVPRGAKPMSPFKITLKY